jgi:hypothetical protein
LRCFLYFLGNDVVIVVRDRWPASEALELRIFEGYGQSLLSLGMKFYMEYRRMNYMIKGSALKLPQPAACLLSIWRSLTWKDLSFSIITIATKSLEGRGCVIGLLQSGA